MPDPRSTVVLSRFFNNNVKLVANMCPRCYEECDDVKIVSVNFIFIRHIAHNFKDLNLAEFDFLNTSNCATANVEENVLGFTEEERNRSLECTGTMNKIVNVKRQFIQNLVEKIAKEKYSVLNSDSNNNNIVCKGFSVPDIVTSTKDHEKVITACETIRYNIYGSINGRIVRNICNVGVNETYLRRLSRKTSEKGRFNRRKKELKRDNKSKDGQSKYFSFMQDTKGNSSSKLPIKEECLKSESYIKQERQQQFLVDPSPYPDKQSHLQTEAETIDYEAEYFKALEDGGCHFKIENSIKTENCLVLKKDEYEDKIPDVKISKWIPPRSPHNLIEECLYHDPWALLVATIFLNKTSCMIARPYVFWFLKDNPDPLKVLDKYPEELEKYFVNLGLQRTRAAQVWRMSHDFIYKSWKSVKELYGVGIYGEDAFRMFCLGDFSVEPKDRFLKIYKAWYQQIASKEELV